MPTLTKTERLIWFVMSPVLFVCAAAFLVVAPRNTPFPVTLVAGALAALAVIAAVTAGWGRDPQEVAAEALAQAVQQAKCDPLDWVAIQEDDVQ